MLHHPWDDRDLAALCAEDDNGLAQSRARRDKTSPIRWWWWLIAAMLIAAGFGLLATFTGW